MDTRRNFLKKIAMLTAGGGLVGTLPAAIEKALAIEPAPGTTYLDAEHVVILMQENRSFDHAYGSLRGVRGFNDPRAVTLPNGNPVWLQSNASGETYAPFRLNMKDTKATWMGSLPHGWIDQGGARNQGHHDRWLDYKHLGHKEYSHLPMTMGYYNRDDLPFFYAFADAFTICDQNFCSSLTATIPNRLHLWTGTTRAHQTADTWANVLNEDLDYDSEVTWTTFPERLEERGISWRIYQNEISLPTGLDGERDAWLTNFGDNPLEWFTQYRVRYSAAHRHFLAKREKDLVAELAASPAAEPVSDERTKQLAAKRAELEQVRADLNTWTDANFAKLSPHEQNLHRKAFTVNDGHPDYRELTTLSYHDGEKERQMEIPKGDVLHQFREDVRGGQLPTVSWIVPPERFSDHPSSPWYGAWYLSETLDILTQNPEVWKKTIFILCYDENDGYFDHVPPFVPPFPDRPETGKVSAGIDPALDHVPQKQEDEMRRKNPNWGGKPGPIGLGFRVPLVIASPWSRGGYVCSEVFDHTSILRLLENVLTHKTDQPMRETNISSWRRAMCGDLSSAFRPEDAQAGATPAPVARDAFLELINQAKYKPVPANFKKLTLEDITQARTQPAASACLPQQEPGVRPACALPYELTVHGVLREDKKSFAIQFAAGSQLFGARSAGAPFHVYSPGPTPARAYAVSAGDHLSDIWTLEAAGYHICVHGPNGFFREFLGTADDPKLEVTLQGTPTGGATLQLVNRDQQSPLAVLIHDVSYGTGLRVAKLAPASEKEAHSTLTYDLASSFGWHDLRIGVEGSPAFSQRFAGRMENGRDGFSDPLLGRPRA